MGSWQRRPEGWWWWWWWWLDYSCATLYYYGTTRKGKTGHGMGIGFGMTTLRHETRDYGLDIAWIALIAFGSIYSIDSMDSMDSIETSSELDAAHFVCL
jgi:hypothetical protein